MKNFNELKELLKRDGYELSPQQQKEIKGGYDTLEECKANCHGGDGSGWNIYTKPGGCKKTSVTSTFI